MNNSDDDWKAHREFLRESARIVRGWPAWIRYGARGLSAPQETPVPPQKTPQQKPEEKPKASGSGA